MTSLQATAMGGGAASTKTANYVLVAADAGTTVAMNAAGATTITVNTGLFAAGDTVFIQNVGAGVCTITAGTATVNTAGALALPQYDAGILYFTSASAAIFYDYIQVGAASPLTTKGDLYTFSTSDTRLGVGANGTVLTAASGEATGLQWAAPAAPALVGCSLFKSASQSISNNTFTAITFNSEDYDTDSFHDTSTNTSRITIPSGKGGKYLITGVIIFQDNATNDRTVYLYKNGVSDQELFAQKNAGGFNTSNGLSFVKVLDAADYIEVFALQNSGGALNIIGGTLATHFQVYYLGA